MFKTLPLCLLACMSGFAAADPGANPDATIEQMAEVDTPTPTKGMEDEEAPVTVAEALSSAEKQRAEDTEDTEAASGLWDQYSQELMGLLALLVLWLVTRLFLQPDIEVKRRTKRQSPLTPDEFTRILFRIMVGEDVEAYRTMYLTGTEACQIMGNTAGADYLKNRSPEVFELAFDALFDRMPAGSRYVKGHLSPSDVVELWVLDSRGMRHCIPVGHVAYIGAIMRLVTPVVGNAASPRVEYVGEPDVLAPTA
jgi:hypothetical protein